MRIHRWTWEVERDCEFDDGALSDFDLIFSVKSGKPVIRSIASNEVISDFPYCPGCGKENIVIDLPEDYERIRNEVDDLSEIEEYD